MLDDTAEHLPLDLPTFHGAPVDDGRPWPPGDSTEPPDDPTDDGLGCDDRGEWQPASWERPIGLLCLAAVIGGAVALFLVR